MSAYVRVQSYPGRGGRLRYAYALHIDGCWPYTSGYRYGSEATARAAGEADLAATLAIEVTP